MRNPALINPTKLKKVYRMKLPATEDRMLIDKETSGKMPPPKIHKEETYDRFGQVNFRITKLRTICQKICMCIENENEDLEWSRL